MWKPLMLASTLAFGQAPIDPGALAGLTGTWLGEEKETRIEEHWRFAEGSYLGMFRMLKAGKSSFFELMAIERSEGGDLVLRIRHFGPFLGSAWEEKNEPTAFRVAAAGPQEITFEGIGKHAGTRLHYTFKDRELTVSLVKTGPDGKTSRSEYRFRKS